MANQPPVEIQKLMRDFDAQQAAERVAKEASRRPKFEKGKTQGEKRQWTSVQLEAEAIRLGFSFDYGGEHPHIVDQNGKYVAPLPEHAGNMPTGTAQGILKSMKNWLNRH